MRYKGYIVGSIEKELLKLILNVKDAELSNKYDESFYNIFKTARQKYQYPETVKRMKEKGLVTFINREGDLKIILTNKGKQFAQNLFLQDYKQLKRPAKWDNKWRMVMFDIPEDKRKLRNMLRFHLKKVGFLQIQGSVWIYPYSCEEIITLIKTNFNFDNEVIYITTESFENDRKFKKVFKL